MDDVGVVEHAELDCVRPDILKHAVDLFGYQFGRDCLHGKHARRILGDHDGDRRHAVQPVCFNGFQIRLDACTPGGVGAGNTENGFHICVSSNPVPSNAGIKLSLMDSSCWKKPQSPRS